MQYPFQSGELNMVLTKQTATTRSTVPVGVTQPALELKLLGGFALCHNGSPVAPPLTAQRLVALLALQDGPISRSYIAGTLWLNSPENKATASLRSALWRLRQFAPGLVVADASTLALRPDVAVDATVVLQHALDLTAGDAPLTAGLLNELIYSKDLLPDWYEDWVLVERESLRQLKLSAVEAAARHLLDGGDYAAAVRAAGAAASDEPLRESAHRIVISAHMAAGNYGAAIRQFELYRKLLHDELQLAPSPHMDKLIGQLTSR